MVAHHHFVVALVVVIPKIVWVQRIALNLLHVLPLAHEVNVVEIQDLALFVVSQVLHEIFQGFGRRTGKRNRLLLLNSVARIQLVR